MVRGYPIQSWSGGTPSSHGGGGVSDPVLAGGYPSTPHHPDLAGAAPHPDLAGVPLHHPDLARVPPYHPDLAGVPKQTENSTFPHPSDAGGNNQLLLMIKVLSFLQIHNKGI